MITQFQSFFNAAFRYTCLFHNNFLLKNSISPRVSYKSKNLKHDIDCILNHFQNVAKLTSTLNFLLPVISVGIGSVGTTSAQNPPGLSICLGEGYQNFLSGQSKMLWCNYDNPIGKNACRLFIVLQVILMSNLIDIYCTYFILKTINSQTEEAKSMIGENAYIHRKRYVYNTYIFLNFFAL